MTATDPLINILRCYIAHDIPDEIAVRALHAARAEVVAQGARASALWLVKRAAIIIRDRN